MRAIWIALYYPEQANSGKLIGTALYGAVRRVVWDSGTNHSRGPDSAWGFGYWIRRSQNRLNPAKRIKDTIARVLRTVIQLP